MEALIVVGPRAATTQPFAISDGTLEALKWIALVFMTGDHVNAVLLQWSQPVLYNAGRLVMPLFGFVLAYNLARPDAFVRGVHVRVMKRLALYAGFTMPSYVQIHGYWPFNVMWTLWLFVFIAYCIERNTQLFTAAAWVALGIGGFFVEFWWIALFYCLGVWAFCKRPTVGALVLWIGSAISLHLINHSFWGMAALPIIFAAPLVNVGLPRIRLAFYAYYPAHLSVLCLVGLVLGTV